MFLRTVVYCFIAAATLGLSACGGGSGSSSSSSGSGDANSSPVFTSGTSISVIENLRSTGYTAQATDADGDTVAYSIGDGSDGALFSIDSSSGVLAFEAAPDFENPQDENSDNIYVVILAATDGRGGTTLQAVAVSVEDLNQLGYEIAYPTPNANLGRYGDTTTVSGVYINLEDGSVVPADSSDLAISVNGQMAESIADSPTKWQATVPVVPGENILGFVSSKPLVGTSNTNLRVVNTMPIVYPRDIELDSSTDTVYVVDGGLNQIVSIDLTTHIRNRILDIPPSSTFYGFDPYDAASDFANNRLIIVNGGSELIEFNLSNGVWRVVSSTSVVTGHHFDTASSVALDVAKVSVEGLDFLIDLIDSQDLNA